METTEIRTLIYKQIELQEQTVILLAQLIEVFKEDQEGEQTEKDRFNVERRETE